MCGIAGFIGQGLHPKATYALMTNLAIKTQERGKEATGIWGAQGTKDGHVIYHKEPISASEFVGKPEWKKLKNFNPNILLMHGREPTQSAGSPKQNKNNHPHVSSDYSVALIHNGKVEEYHKHRSQYDATLKSQCDSEMILRIFETGEYISNQDIIAKYPHLDPENALRVLGIEEIFKKLDKSAFACAVGERHEGTRRSLWMFRNEKRPLHMIDLRSSMGQIFFCSTMQIWRESVEATHEVKHIIPLDHMVVEFPVQYAYAISFDPAADDEFDKDGKPLEGGWKAGWKIRKYRLTLKREYGEEEEKAIKLSEFSPRPARNLSVYTKLNTNDEIINEASVMNRAATGQEDTVETPPEVATTQENLDADPVPGGDDGDVHVDNVRLKVERKKTEPISEEMTAMVAVSGGTEFKPPFDQAEAPEVDAEVDEETATTEEPETSESYDLEKMSVLANDIKQTISLISTEAHNRAMEGDIRLDHFSTLVEDMSQLFADAKSVLYLVQKSST